MNLYSLNTIKQNYCIIDTVLQYNTGLHTEDMMIEFYSTDQKDLVEKYAFLENNVLFQSWMSLLDLNDADSVSTPSLISKLNQVMKLLHLQDEIMLCNYSGFLTTIDVLGYTEMITSVLDILKEIFETRPILGYLYPYFYRIMAALNQYIEKQTDLQTADSLIQKTGLSLIKEIKSILESYNVAVEYVKDVFVIPFETGIKAPTSRIALFYQSYCLHIKKENFYSQIHSAKALNDVMNEGKKEVKWSEFLSNVSSTINDPLAGYTAFTFHHINDFIGWGIDQMTNQEMVLRKCQNCGGYFCVKYTSVQEYCNRSFSNASTCSEYASRKSYKNRLFENPINTEYTKSYNKLYARIRRKKLPADTPLKDELLKLRNEYMERYEHTSKKEREAVWKEYIQKNIELLG